MCYYNIIVNYVGGEQLRTSMKAPSLPSSTVDRSTGEDNIIVQNIVYANSDSGLLFIMCGHCSPVVVWYNYLAWHISMNEIVKG